MAKSKKIHESTLTCSAVTRQGGGKSVAQFTVEDGDAMFADKARGPAGNRISLPVNTANGPVFDPDKVYRLTIEEVGDAPQADTPA